MRKLGRGLDKAEEFKKTKWYDFYMNHKEELVFGIRNNYINIYYKGMSIAKVGGKFETANIADKYLGNQGKSKIKCISLKEFETKYEEIKKCVDEYVIQKNKQEKKIQQELILRNNANKNSHWVCIDMEYQKQRKNKKDGQSPGRFDIIAVSKAKPHRVALVELKVGNKAFSEPSGLRKHAKDWNDFLEESLFMKSEKRDREDYLLKEIVAIINNKNDLEGCYPIQRCQEIDFKKEPEFYFLICSGNKKTVEEIKNHVGQYLWKKETAYRNNIRGRISSRNIENDLQYDITKKKAGRLYVNFLFAEGEGTQIQDIIDDQNYDKKIV